MFNIIYIFSPSIDIDHTRRPVKDYIAKEIKPHEREQLYFDSYNPVEVEAVVDKEHEVTSYLKSQGHTNMLQILIILDDFVDSPEFTRQSKLLHHFLHEKSASMYQYTNKYTCL